MKGYELLTIDEVAKLLRVSERTVYDWAQKGEIPCGKFGTNWRFRKGEVLKWIDSRLKTPKSDIKNTSFDISAVLTKERIKLLNVTSKNSALIELAEVLSDSSLIHNQEELLKEIFKREELMSTGVGLGIGVPHVRLNSVEDIVMAVGVVKNNTLTDYESLDGEGVNIICMIAGHSDQHSRHIKLLSQISRLLKDDLVRAEVLNASGEEEIYNILTKR